MEGHLTAEQLSGWIVGERPDAALQHVRSCLDCRAEIDRFQGTLTQFHDAVHEWSDAQIGSASPVTPASRRLAWTLAAAVMLLCVCLSLPFLKRQPATAESDAALLSSIHSQVSRTVPSPMEPLTRLIPFEAQQ